MSEEEEKEELEVEKEKGVKVEKLGRVVNHKEEQTTQRTATTRRATGSLGEGGAERGSRC